MKFFIILFFLTFTACEGNLVKDNADKRNSKKTVQTLSFDWSGLSDKYESGAQFKDID